jgi:hypothetical protein
MGAEKSPATGAVREGRECEEESGRAAAVTTAGESGAAGGKWDDQLSRSTYS